jgi:hypothetical protein
MNGCAVAGGSRRRSRKNRKGTKRRGGAGCGGETPIMKGGMYGFGGPLAGTTAGADWNKVSDNINLDGAGKPVPDPVPLTGGRRKTIKMKDIKKMLKKNGLKTTGRKSTLLKRMKKAKIMKGGADYLPSAGASAGFTGTGIRGMGIYTDTSTPMNAGVVPLK